MKPTLLFLAAALACAGACKKSNSDDGAEDQPTSEKVTGPGEAEAPVDQGPSDTVTPSSDGAVVAIGKRIYWVAGTTGAPDTLVRSFDLEDETWRRHAPVGEAKLKVTGVEVDGDIVVAGGMTGISARSDLVERYDAEANEWKKLATLASARAGAAVARVGDHLYVISGAGAEFSMVDDVEAVSLADGSVSAKKPIPLARDGAAAVVVDDTIWVIGGERDDPNDPDALPKNTDAVDIYDPKTDTWSEGPALPSRGTGAAALVGRTIVFLGSGALSPDEPFVYDLDAGDDAAWKQLEPRDDDAVGDVIEGAVVIDGTLYVLGQVLQGISEPSLVKLSTFDPATGAWAPVY